MHGPITKVAFAAGVLGAIVVLAGCQDFDAAGGTSSTGAIATDTTLPNPLKTSWVMPNLVGANLQDAQNQIQKLTHYEVFYTTSHDVTGQGRHQILDRDWKVCSQNVQAGASITITTKIDFGTAKTAESCP
jgi:hypothetical protein